MTQDTGAHETADLFRLLFRKVKQEWVQVVEQSISASQALILHHLQCKGKLKVSDLAELMKVSNGAVTALTDKLVASGYAVRQRAMDDRRVVYLTITPEGEEMSRQVKKREAELIERMFSRLSTEELALLSQFFKMMLSNLE